MNGFTRAVRWLGPSILFAFVVIWFLSIIMFNDGPTPREYVFHYPTCFSIGQRDWCFSKALLPCTPNGWDDNGSMVCSKAKVVWECPAISAPLDDGHFESLRCTNFAFTWTDGRQPLPDWKCDLSLFTYMDPRKWEP